MASAHAKVTAPRLLPLLLLLSKNSCDSGASSLLRLTDSCLKVSLTFVSIAIRPPRKSSSAYSLRPSLSYPIFPPTVSFHNSPILRGVSRLRQDPLPDFTLLTATPKLRSLGLIRPDVGAGYTFLHFFVSFIPLPGLTQQKTCNTSLGKTAGLLHVL